MCVYINEIMYFTEGIEEGGGLLTCNLCHNDNLA